MLAGEVKKEKKVLTMGVYHKILSGITQKLNADNQFEQALERFKAATDTIEKFRIIDELERSGCFQRPQLQPRSPKSNNQSTTYRLSGNKHYGKQTNAGYLVALKHYNESVCYAEEDSEELGLGFANRSAVYFDLGLYDDCLQNIQLAKRTVPARVINKLNNREKQCLERKHSEKMSPAAGINPELSLPANDQIPFLAECLQLQRNEQFGRHIITTTDLLPGDVIGIEESFCSTLDLKFKYERCENCLREHNYNLIPCTHCSSVMFCGEKCRDEAYEKFHKIECPIIDLATELLCDKSFITFRTVTCAIASFNSVEQLITFIEETKGQDLTLFDGNYKEKSHNAYVPVHFSAERINVDTDFASYILVSLISQPLLELTPLKDTFTTTKAVHVVKELFLHHIKRLPSQRSGALYFDGSLFDEYALGIFPFRNLLNHSCVPNVMISSIDRKLVYTVLRPMKAGEQLFDNYG